MSADAVAMGAGNGGGNGRKLRLLTLDDLDGRTRARRHADELRERLISERGGADRLDAMRLAYTSTWAAFTALIEDQLTRLFLGEPIDPARIATIANARRREGEMIGAPEPRDVTLSVADIAKEYARRAAVAQDSTSAPSAPSGATDAVERTSGHAKANGEP
jgi:hypothetical protein